MANHQGNGRGAGRDDEDRYRMRDDDERFERGYGSHWEDRDRGYESRWSDRSGSPWGRSSWSQQGYGYNDSDRPSSSGRNGLYGGGGYEPVPGPGARQQNRYGSQGYGESGQSGYSGTARPSARRGYRGKGPQGFVRSDERVRELVCEALTDDDEVDATHVEVSVKNGEVVLAGSVEDREMKRRSEDVVERVPGVRDVHNQLRIRT